MGALLAACLLPSGRDFVWLHTPCPSLLPKTVPPCQTASGDLRWAFPGRGLMDAAQAQLQAESEDRRAKGDQELPPRTRGLCGVRKMRELLQIPWDAWIVLLITCHTSLGMKPWTVDRYAYLVFIEPPNPHVHGPFAHLTVRLLVALQDNKSSARQRGF